MAASASLILRWLGRQGRMLLFTAGLAAISAGVGWVFPPAGLITAGLLVSSLVVFERVGASREPPVPPAEPPR